LRSKEKNRNPNLTPDITDAIRKDSEKKKKKGGGYPTGLHSPDHRKKGTAARPVDGGALTRKGNARTGDWTGDGAISAHSRRMILRSCGQKGKEQRKGVGKRAPPR
jgi:hypothetical protein